MFDKINKFLPEKWRWVLSHEGFRKYFKNTGWLFFGQMFSLLVAFLAGILVARYLGPKNYGLLNYSIGFASLFSFITAIGSDIVISREIIKNNQEADKIMSSGFVLKFIGGSFAFLSALTFSFIFNDSGLIHLMIAIYSLTFIATSFQITGSFFQSKVMAKKNVISQIIASAISLTVKLIIIKLGLGIIYLAASYVLDACLLAILLISAYLASEKKVFKFAFDRVLFYKILKYSWPLMLSAAASFLLLRIDQVIIGKLLGDVSVGIYSAAVKLVEIFYFIPTLVCYSLFPAIVNARQGSDVSFAKRLKSLYLFMFFVALFLAVFLSLFSRPIISLIFGQEYSAAAPILRIYAWSNIGMFLGMAINYRLISENREKFIFLTQIVLVIINVALNLAFLPLFGMAGSALATLISYSLWPILMSLNKKTSNNN